MTAEPLMRPVREVGQVLSDAVSVTGPGLREAVSRLPERVRRPVGVHLGWWDSSGRPLQGRAGKMMRPALALLACEAVGGETAAGVPAAVAVELVHNASLLHDDLIDGDRLRRGRPAVWSEMGTAAAVLAGDALFFLAVQVLDQGPPSLRATEARELTGAEQELIEGEYADIQMENTVGPSVEEVQATAAGKTGALVAAACALGALAGGGDEHRVTHLRAFGAHLGAAFQLVDDLLGIWGDPRRTGKPVGSDLAARKKSLPVAAALGADGPAAHQLRELYAGPGPLSPAEQELAARLVEQAGGRAWAKKEGERHTRLALERLHAAGPEPVAGAELVALARLFTARDH
ncbi:polyprenyl synthetase family protein [Streptomyces sp. NPDC003006]